jgi:DNA polymerase sigma
VGQALVQIQEILRERIESFCKNSFKLEVFGSFATKLSLPYSDLDLIVDTQEVPVEFLSRLNQSLQESREVSERHLISNASIPVLKISFQIEGQSFQVDISVKTSNHYGQQCVELVRNIINYYAPAKYLILVLKQIVYKAQMNNPYQGGLSSYGLTLLVLAFFQFQKFHRKYSNSEKAVGKILFDFLSFYGTQFNYQTQYLQPSFFFDQEINPVQFKAQNSLAGNNSLVVIDPLNVSNNVTRSSYRFQLIQNLFLLSLEEITDNCPLELETLHSKLLHNPQENIELEIGSGNCNLLQRLFNIDLAFLNVTEIK